MPYRLATPLYFLHRLRHCAPFELLTQRPNHTIAATTPHPLNASALAQSVAMPVSHGTFQPCAGMSVASVSSFIGRSQPNNYYSACRFHTAHRQAPCSGLTLPRCRNAVAYIWQGRLGIEPTQAVLETASPALEHSPLCLSCAQPELHRGVKGKYQLPETSCFYRPQLIFLWSTGRDASPETIPAMAQTVGDAPNSPQRIVYGWDVCI